ncbi:hypothetical protein K7432_014221, partial [Basidiobolus ranarum]
QHIQPIPISSVQIGPGMEASSAGWMPTLSKTKMHILPSNSCDNYYQGSPSDHSAYLCVAGGFCLPEVGGPLYTLQGERYELVGIKTNSSVLNKPEIDCYKTNRDNDVGIYTNLGHHLTYITEATGLREDFLVGKHHRSAWVSEQASQVPLTVNSSDSRRPCRTAYSLDSNLSFSHLK